jgi:hypothetical protein
MRVIFIDGVNKKIEELEIEGSLKELQDLAAAQSGIICIANYITYNGTENIIYIDDEGLLGNKFPMKGFEYKGIFYAGNGVIVGSNHGDSISSNLLVTDLNRMIDFVEKNEEEVVEMLNTGFKIFSDGIELNY